MRARIFPSIAVKFICLVLLGMFIALSIGDGIDGRWSEMQHHISWALWIGTTVFLLTVVENRNEAIEVKDSYIKSLERYKDISDKHAKSLKEQVENYKTLSETNGQTIENYKSQKPSRF